jgi:hypothetical protein
MKLVLEYLRILVCAIDFNVIKKSDTLSKLARSIVRYSQIHDEECPVEIALNF